MIIASQNKDQIVNFNNIEIMFLKQKEIWYQGIYGEGYQLAEYKTEERAKEVLQEIAETYLKIGIEFKTYCGGTQQQLPIYEMPKEC